MPAEIANQQVIELLFPANEGVVDELLYAYDNSYRQPGTTTFVLDTSGSMEGERIASLKDIMHSLIDGSASTLTGDVSLRDRENGTLQSFASRPNTLMGSAPAAPPRCTRRCWQRCARRIRPAGSRR